MVSGTAKRQKVSCKLLSLRLRSCAEQSLQLDSQPLELQSDRFITSFDLAEHSILSSVAQLVCTEAKTLRPRLDKVCTAADGHAGLTAEQAPTGCACS